LGISFKVDGIPIYAATLLFMVWDWTTIEHSEEVKIIMLNRANRVLGVNGNYNCRVFGK